MADTIRQDPPHAAPEPEMLAAFLDYQRATLLRKIAGLSDEDLRRSLVPSGVTLLGMVKHLAYVERWWSRIVFAGEQAPVPWTDQDPDADWRILPEETTDQILALYRAELELTRAIAAAASPEDHARRAGKEDFTLRWILLHMIEEVARHAGHADILRELTDGATGE